MVSGREDPEGGPVEVVLAAAAVLVAVVLIAVETAHVEGVWIEVVQLGKTEVVGSDRFAEAVPGELALRWSSSEVVTRVMRWVEVGGRKEER